MGLARLCVLGEDDIGCTVFPGEGESSDTSESPGLGGRLSGLNPASVEIASPLYPSVSLSIKWVTTRI